MNGNGQIAEGDIKVNQYFKLLKEVQKQTGTRKDFINYPRYQWPTRNIPYEFDPALGI